MAEPSVIVCDYVRIFRTGRWSSKWEVRTRGRWTLLVSGRSLTSRQARRKSEKWLISFQRARVKSW